MAISNCESIRKAHNSFSRPEPFAMEDSKSAKPSQDVYHFISYVPIDGQLYELDGLKKGPINLGTCTQVRHGAWTELRWEGEEGEDGVFQLFRKLVLQPSTSAIWPFIFLSFFFGGGLFSNKQEDWLDKVCPVIMKRIEQYSQNEIRFNLLALIKNKIDVCKKSIEDLQKEKAQALGASNGGEEGMDVDTNNPKVLQLDQEIAR